MIVSISEYRRITDDYSSFDGYVETALKNSQDRLEEETFRKFEKDTYTDVVRYHSDGKVYPPSTPVESITSWSNPVWGLRYQTTEVTYVGGFTPAKMPQEIKIAVAEIARSWLRPSETSIPVGATRVRVGDVSYSGSSLGDNTDLPASVKATIRKWRVREH